MVLHRRGGSIKAGIFFKNQLIQTQEQSIPMRRKATKDGRRLGWINKKLVKNIKRKQIRGGTRVR